MPDAPDPLAGSHPFHPGRSDDRPDDRPDARRGDAPPTDDARGEPAEPLPPDRSRELSDRSYRMADYTWFRIPGRVAALPAPHYLGHGFAYSARYNIRTVWQAPMEQHVVVKVALSPGGVVANARDAQPRRLRSGEVILRYVQEPEFWEAFDGRRRRPWEFLGLILNGAAAATTADALIRRYGRVYDLGRSHRLVRRLLDLAHEPSHVTEMTGTEAMHLAHGVFEALYAAADAGAVRFKSVELAVAAEALIRDRIGHDWTVSELAGRLDVSREHLTRAFSDRHGVPPHRFLTELRIQETCRRLRSTADPIKTIFHDLGFKSHTSFSRAFRRYHQVSPGDYREMRG